MKVDGSIGWDLDRVGGEARELEEMGYSGVFTAETGHDPFLPLAIAAQATSHVDIATSIAVAFARSPLTLAHVGHDLNAASRGRFVLGLGSQIRPHITKRFSMPWSQPAARMREFILAMRAIWANWHEGAPLQFTGKFYTHTLMTPFFMPGNTEFGPPRVFLAAVGPLMTEVAGEVADGIIVHPFTTEKYLRETTVPALERGFAKAGKRRSDFEVRYPCFVVTGRDERELAAASTATRQQVAFYGSTPAYRPVLDSIGAGELQGELNAMSKQGRWAEMGTLVTYDMLDAFGIVGPPEEVAGRILARYGDIVDRTSVAYANLPKDAQAKIVAQLTATWRQKKQ